MQKELPKVLAGPIIRWVTPESFTIWIATSVPLELTVQTLLYQIVSGAPKPIGDPAKPRTKSNSIQLLEKLYVCTISIDLPKDIRKCRQGFLSYDLGEQDFEFGEGFKSVGFTAKDEGLPHLGPENTPPPVEPVKKDDAWKWLPSVPVPLAEHGGKANFMVGSCRKPHGRGEDAYSAIYSKVRADHRTENRVNGMFLLGDQIYVDDVATGVFEQVQSLAKRLCNGGEIVEGLGRVTELRGKPRTIVIQTRTGFTADKDTSENHLLGFSEYCAAYLLWWGTGLIGPTGTKEVIALRKSAEQFRFIHANIPTYMMVDDHEITDDWNLDFEWTQRTNNPTRVCKQQGEQVNQVVANGTLAFLAFQFFGCPHVEPLNEKILKKVKVALSHTSKTDISLPSSLAKEVVQNCKALSYKCPHSIPICLVDSRTDREFKNAEARHGANAGFAIEYRRNGIIQAPWTGGNEDRPLLIGAQTQQQLAKAIKEGSSDLAVLGIATPAFGYPIVEDILQEGLASFLGGKYGVDRESWFTNPLSFITLINLLRSAPNIKRLLLLAGDVHYSFGVSGLISLYHEGVPQAKPRMISFGQLTSSPVCNRLAGNQQLMSHVGPLNVSLVGGGYFWATWDDARQVMLIDRVDALELINPVNFLAEVASAVARHRGKYADFSVSYSRGGSSAVLEKFRALIHLPQAIGLKDLAYSDRNQFWRFGLGNDNDFADLGKISSRE